MLGFGPLSSLPLSDSGVQTIRDVGGIPTRRSFGVGTLSNGVLGGGGKYQRIRTVVAPVQYFRASAIAHHRVVGRMVAMPTPCAQFHALSIPSRRRVSPFTFVVEEYIPPSVSLEWTPIAETWSHFATSEIQVISVELDPMPSISLELSIEQKLELSIAPVIELESAYVQ